MSNLDKPNPSNKKITIDYDDKPKRLLLSYQEYLGLDKIKKYDKSSNKFISKNKEIFGKWP